MNLIGLVKEQIKKLIKSNRYSSETYVEYLKRGGAKIGEGTYFYDPIHVVVDEGNLPFIKIGKNCRITKDVIILAHDYSYAVMSPIYHCMLKKAGVTSIGNNVFIGMRAIILMGSNIGNNCIIGAGSVVSGTYPDNVVIAGNPAKIICSLEEYYRKNLEKFEEYAKITYFVKKDSLHRNVKETDMDWYNQLWKSSKAKEIYNNIAVDGDNKEEIIMDLMKIQPKYDSFLDFVNSIENIKREEENCNEVL